MKRNLLFLVVILFFAFLIGCGTSKPLNETGKTQGDESLPAIEEKQEKEGDEKALLKKLNYEVTSDKRKSQITFHMKLTNPTEEQITLSFPSGQQYEILVKDEETEEVVYRYSEGRMFTQAIVDYDLPPGESQTWAETWDFKGKEGKIEPGKYVATVTLLPAPFTRSSVDKNPFVKEIPITIADNSEG
ncbi:Intracellular proteinase inhibitor [Salinibacillus kushneri]|uniref:Intracellular proteinase inhibitor n=1 Tax=Salinibacillus kushneri TaxID=237682 RepID=A0A1I0J1M8_9BACI|nr:BsuPI-related putative proteinase inhibitor [Salinibacillus kushneri]SEU03664.1 Intracellular proteinase inhibitor [Salinibacillus kushneri]